jgi:hypothetical protein
MSIVVVVIGIALVVCGVGILLLRARADESSGGASGLKLGDMHISSAKPSLFLIGVGVVVLIVGAVMYNNEMEREKICKISGMC